MSVIQDVGGPGHVSDDESDWEDVDGHGSTSLHSVENSPSRMSPSRNPTTTTNATTPAEFAKVEQEVRVDDTGIVAACVCRSAVHGLSAGVSSGQMV